MMWLLARLPWRMLIRLGGGLGWLLAHLKHPRERIALRNVALCFPALSAKQQDALVKAHMRDLGYMLSEFTQGWLGSNRQIARIPHRIEGLAHLEAARRQGKGVLLVGGHFSHLELCGRILAQQIPLAGMYRKMDSAVFDWIVLRARIGYADAMFDKDDLRGAVKYLRDGGVLWYAPDQDMRGKKHVFVPFFDVPAATIPATHHIARLGQARVIPFFHRRLPDGEGYVLRLGEPLAHFPSNDVFEDTARINAEIEQMVIEAPEQYFWVHQRFKSRPEGVPPVY